MQYAEQGTLECAVRSMRSRAPKYAVCGALVCQAGSSPFAPYSAKQSQARHLKSWPLRAGKTGGPPTDAAGWSIDDLVKGSTIGCWVHDQTEVCHGVLDLHDHAATVESQMEDWSRNWVIQVEVIQVEAARVSLFQRSNKHWLLVCLVPKLLRIPARTLDLAVMVPVLLTNMPR